MSELNLELKHFKIDRSKWRTGKNGNNQTGEGGTYLLNGKGFSCCLGQCASQIGVEDRNLLMYGSPHVIGIELPRFSFFNSNDDLLQITYLSSMAMEINDNRFTTPQEKEEELTKLFNEHGLTIEFVGEYVKQNE